MISFVWSAQYPFLAGSGGSENYTVGHIRELRRRDIASRIITIGHGQADGRSDFPDVEFLSLANAQALSGLDDLIVFVTYPHKVRTVHKPFVLLHCPPISQGAVNPLFDFAALAGANLLATSAYSANLWSQITRHTLGPIRVVYPFAEDCFRTVSRPPRTPGQVKILYAGRLTPDKGIYTLLAALHMPEMKAMDYSLTATTSGSHDEPARVILPVMQAHPWVNLVPARKSPRAMAELMAQHDIVVMPTTNLFWHEMFGIVSVEAQHAGCRVVASNAGGLPETDCGNLTLVRPDNPVSFSQEIARAVALGPVPASARTAAGTNFRLKNSVDQLLKVLDTPQPAVKPSVQQPLRQAQSALKPGRRLSESAKL